MFAYLIDLYEGILTRWQRGTANTGIGIPLCWPFAVLTVERDVYFWIFSKKKQLKWKLSDNIIEYYGHLIVLYVYLYEYIAHTTDNSRHDAKLSEVGSVLNIFTVGCSRNNFYIHTIIHTRFMRTHTQNPYKSLNGWQTSFFSFFYVLYLTLCIFLHPLLWNIMYTQPPLH